MTTDERACRWANAIERISRLGDCEKAEVFRVLTGCYGSPTRQRGNVVMGFQPVMRADRLEAHLHIF